MAFGSTNKSGQDQLWYQNPPMSLQPENVRPYTFSQSPSRDGLFLEDTGDLPQQTAGTGNISMDLSSKVSMGGVQNNQKYNFDVQSNPTSFVYNNQNINNFTAIPPAVQDAIYNNTTVENINNYTTGSGGASGTVVALSNPVWDESGSAGGNMTITFTSRTFTFSNGLVTTVTTNANAQITLDKLKTLSNWYNNGIHPGSDLTQVFGSGIGINTGGTALEQDNDSWVFDHGLVKSITSTTKGSTPITTCP